MRVDPSAGHIALPLRLSHVRVGTAFEGLGSPEDY